MPFFDFPSLTLRDFRPGIRSAAHLGEQLILAVMTIEAGMKDGGHIHPFDQCGFILDGSLAMTIGEETRIMGPGQGYFIPAGVSHGWSAGSRPVTLVDISPRTPAAD